MEKLMDPAIRMYQKYGFIEYGPFADYVLDPFSRFFIRVLR